MIIEFLLNVISSFIQLVFLPLPSIPAMPEWIDTTVSTFTNILLNGVSLLAYIFTTQLVIFVVTTWLVIINFDYIYHGVLWILRKLPFSIH